MGYTWGMRSRIIWRHGIEHCHPWSKCEEFSYKLTEGGKACGTSPHTSPSSPQKYHQPPVAFWKQVLVSTNGNRRNKFRQRESTALFGRLERGSGESKNARKKFPLPHTKKRAVGQTLALLSHFLFVPFSPSPSELLGFKSEEIDHSRCQPPGSVLGTRFPRLRLLLGIQVFTGLKGFLPLNPFSWLFNS